MGKDQYFDSLDGMISGRILPWVQDSQSESYPIWSNYDANQRDVFFLDYNGIIDTSFSITPYNSSNPEDVQYLKDIILGLRTNQSLEINNLVVPETYFLHQNFPNPFNPSTKIGWELPKNEFVNITIYNSMGKAVKTLVNSFQSSGYKTINWDATDSRNKPVSAGLYIYRLQSDSHSETKKMILLH
jgi:hypothetical protein|tara:strand:- start:62 stop:619 length:558 start_codon:yes stop_codon:yes gene_type:complete